MLKIQMNRRTHKQRQIRRERERERKKERRKERKKALATPGKTHGFSTKSSEIRSTHRHGRSRNRGVTWPSETEDGRVAWIVWPHRVNTHEQLPQQRLVAQLSNTSSTDGFYTCSAQRDFSCFDRLTAVETVAETTTVDDHPSVQ